MDNSPDPLDDDLHDLLALYREAVGPPEASEERIRLSLQATVADWSTPPKPASTGLLLFTPRARRALVFTLSAAAALALTVGLSSYLGVQHRPTPVHEQAVYSQPEGTSAASIHPSAPGSHDRTPHSATRRDEAPRSDPQPGAQGADDDPREATPPDAPDKSDKNNTSDKNDKSDTKNLSEDDESRGLRPSTQSPRADAPSPREAQDPKPAQPGGEANATLNQRDPSPADNDNDNDHDPQRNPAQTPGTADAPASLDLARELKLIREAERHLRAGHERDALAALDRHRREFPEGQLEPEREASQVTLLCLQGDAAEAERRAKRFAKRWPSSPLLPRVRRVCDAT